VGTSILEEHTGGGMSLQNIGTHLHSEKHKSQPCFLFIFSGNKLLVIDFVEVTCFENYLVLFICGLFNDTVSS
jgi:hypothetical protein